MPSSLLMLSEDDRATLECWTRSSTVRAGHCERARIVLAIADGAGTSATARMLGVSRPTVIKWRDRFAVHGLAGLDDQPRSGRPKTIDDAQIIAATLEPPPAALAVTHWSSRLLGNSRSATRRSLARGAPTASNPGGPGRSSSPPSRTGGQGPRRRRPLSRPAAQRGRALRGREVPDPGAQSHPADPADAARTARTGHPRLQTQRHHHTLRRAGSRDRDRDRPLLRPSRQGRVPGLPQTSRARLPAPQAARRARQLPHPQARRHQPMA